MRVVVVGLYGTGLFFGVIVLLTLLALFAVHRQVVRPIRRLSEAADQVSHGDLTQTVTVGSTDEIGILCQWTVVNGYRHHGRRTPEDQRFGKPGMLVENPLILTNIRE